MSQCLSFTHIERLTGVLFKTITVNMKQSLSNGTSPKNSFMGAEKIAEKI
jgi:hypothetical protein